MGSTKRTTRSMSAEVAAESTVSQLVAGDSSQDTIRPFEALVQLAPDAMVVVDNGGRIRSVNHLTEKLFGYSADELLDQPVEMLVPERLRGVHQQHRAGYAAAPYVRPFGTGLPLSGRKQDGSEFPLQASLAPVQDKD